MTADYTEKPLKGVLPAHLEHELEYLRQMCLTMSFHLENIINGIDGIKDLAWFRNQIAPELLLRKAADLEV